MPWKVQKKGEQYAVVKKGSGEVIARHPNKIRAAAQVKALYANYHEGDKPKYKKSKSARSNRMAKAASRRLMSSRKNNNDNEHDYR